MSNNECYKYRPHAFSDNYAVYNCDFCEMKSHLDTHNMTSNYIFIIDNEPKIQVMCKKCRITRFQDLSYKNLNLLRQQSILMSIIIRLQKHDPNIFLLKDK